MSLFKLKGKCAIHTQRKFLFLKKEYVFGLRPATKRWLLIFGNNGSIGMTAVPGTILMSSHRNRKQTNGRTDRKKIIDVDNKCDCRDCF